jgi:hypothetical protein
MSRGRPYDPERAPVVRWNSVKREVLSFALKETTHALRFAQSAARRFTTEIDELEIGSKMAISVAYIQNRLTDAQASLGAAAEEIGRLIDEADIK